MASTRITTNGAALSTFKGNKVLSLNPQGRASISFGLGKAMVIMENLPEICAFLISDGGSLEMSPEIKERIAAFAKEFLPKEQG